MRALAILGFTLLGTAFGCHGQNSNVKSAAGADSANEVVYMGDFIHLTYDAGTDEPDGHQKTAGTYRAQSSTLTNHAHRTGRFTMDKRIITFTDGADQAVTRMTAPDLINLQDFYNRKQDVQANSLASDNGMTSAVTATHPLPYMTMTLVDHDRFEATRNPDFPDSATFPTAGTYVQGLHWNGETHYQQGQPQAAAEKDQPFDLDNALLLTDNGSYYIDLSIGAGKSGLEVRLNFGMTDGAPGVAHAD